MLKRFLTKYSFFIAIFICLLFFVAYSTLSIVRHNHYQSFGYDLGINDQVVWRYAHFQAPVTTIDPFPNKTKLVEHIELVYALIAPFYWIWDTRKMLLLVEAFAICASVIPIYLLARKRGLSLWTSNAIVVGYLGFYGVQQVMWLDTHSATYGAAFLSWFIYFVDTKKKWISVLFFFLAITAKENIGLLTFLTAFVFFIKDRRKLLLFFMGASVIYVSFIFFVYFPYIVQMKYLYANSGGLFSNLNPLTFFDTDEKRQVIWYSLLSFGFLPLLSPLSLLPVMGDLATYFVIANHLPGAQGLTGQYRVTLTPFLAWGTIMTISRFRMLNKWYIALYLLICTMLVQYILHQPLSYLTKSWFWTESPAVSNINTLIREDLPKTASVVSQNNITPHISHRDKIYTLYPEKKIFPKNSPCGLQICNWFGWYGTPEYLIVDTSSEWDARHLLTDRPLFLDGLKNLEKTHVISLYKQTGDATLYKVNQNPEEYK